MGRTLESTVLHTIRIRLLQDYPAQIAACLDALSEEQIWWRPNDQTNAVGNLVVHLAGSNHYYFEQVLAGADVARDRDGEFAARGGLSKAEVRGRWAASLSSMQAVLDGLTPDALLQTTDRTGKMTTYAQILLHVSHHNAIHTGQILWVTKMVLPGALDDLGRKLRNR